MIDYTTLIQPFLSRTSGELKERVYLRYKRIHGEPYRDMSFAEFGARTRETFAGFAKLGVQRGDRIALLSESRPEWLMADFAALALGAIIVPMFPTLTAQQVEFIVNNSGAKLLLVSNDLQFGKAKKIVEACPALEAIVIFNDSTTLAKPSTPRIMHFAELSTLGGSAPDFDHEAARATPDDLATIIYTSGTTGNPKGVMLTHHNVLSDLDGAIGMLPHIDEHDVALSFLPLCHAFEHIAMHLFMMMGFTVGLAESVDTVAENMLEIRPTIMTGVPRFYERVYSRLMRARDKLTPAKRRIFDWGLAVGAKNGRGLEGQPVPLTAKLLKPLADKLVLEKIREKTGGRVRYFISGAAALPAEVGRAFASFGMPIIEGFGLTETSPIISVSNYKRLKWGFVGKPMPNIEIRIAEDGEILTRGPHVMKGYYKLPDETREVIDADGWFHTGDIGEFDSAGDLRITERKKHLLVSSGGKNIAPAPIESLLTQSRYIDQIMLIGDKRQFCTALIVPDFSSLREAGIARGSEKDVVGNSEVRAAINADIEMLQKELASYERVRRFELLHEAFTVENGMMTPTMKVKRKAVEERYRELIESLYQGRSTG